MKFTINTNDFKSAVKRLTLVAIKGTLPTTSAIQFEYDGREMMMTTNNLQQQRTIKIAVVSDSDEPCKFTIDCVKMNKLLTCIRTDNVVIEYDGFDKCKVDIGTTITFTSVATSAKYLAIHKTLTPKINIMKDTKDCVAIIPHEALKMIDSLADAFQGNKTSSKDCKDNGSRCRYYAVHTERL